MQLASDNEGIQFADKMEENGYVPFVLSYRVAPNQYPAAQDDLVCAIERIRSHAATYHINPENIMIMGSSAVGHLCASVAAMNKDKRNRPNKVCLNYPVINFQKEMHEDSALALTGNNPELIKLLSVDEHVTKDYPKTFLWVCEDDREVPPSNSIRMAKALEENGVEYEFHVYPQGGHGCGLAVGSSAEGWSNEMIKFMNK